MALSSFMANLQHKAVLATGGAALIIVAGCTQASDLNQGGRIVPQRSVGTEQAERLKPAPLTPVQQGGLEPAQPSNPTPPPAQTAINETSVPETPGTTVQAPSTTAAANAQPVTREAMLGFWDLNYKGSSCKMFLNLTPQGSNWRGGTLRCPDALRPSIKAWNVKGKEVILYNGAGSRVATLYRNANSSFSGTASDGSAISAAREG